jgi:hypothetical protein
LPVFKLCSFAIEVGRRWPRKVRATNLATARIRRGTFSPASVRRYCADPCFRVVAAEILRRAGLSRRQRVELLRRFAAEERARPDILVLVDRERGVEFRVEGNRVEKLPTISPGESV